MQREQKEYVCEKDDQMNRIEYGKEQEAMNCGRDGYNDNDNNDTCDVGWGRPGTLSDQ